MIEASAELPAGGDHSGAGPAAIEASAELPAGGDHSGAGPASRPFATLRASAELPAGGDHSGAGPAAIEASAELPADGDHGPAAIEASAELPAGGDHHAPGPRRSRLGRAAAAIHTAVAQPLKVQPPGTASARAYSSEWRGCAVALRLNLGGFGVGRHPALRGTGLPKNQWGADAQNRARVKRAMALVGA